CRAASPRRWRRLRGASRLSRTTSRTSAASFIRLGASGGSSCWNSPYYRTSQPSAARTERSAADGLEVAPHRPLAGHLPTGRGRRGRRRPTSLLRLPRPLGRFLAPRVGEPRPESPDGREHQRRQRVPDLVVILHRPLPGRRTGLGLEVGLSPEDLKGRLLVE